MSANGRNNIELNTTDEKKMTLTMDSIYFFEFDRRAIEIRIKIASIIAMPRNVHRNKNCRRALSDLLAAIFPVYSSRSTAKTLQLKYYTLPIKSTFI